MIYVLAFFFQSDRPTQYQETHSTVNEEKNGDGLMHAIAMAKTVFLKYALRYVVVHYFRVSLYTFSLWAFVLFGFVLSFLCFQRRIVCLRYRHQQQ